LHEFLKGKCAVANQLFEDVEDGFSGLRSKFTCLHVRSLSVAVPAMKVAFVRQFIEMIDIIHMGIMLHYPVILQGGSGQGRHTAIEFVAQSLGYRLLTFGLSSATSIEDLFCKIVPVRRDGRLEFVLQKSRLLNEVDANTAGQNTIIVLEDLNQAAASVLDALTPLFDTTKKSFLLPNGDIVEKGQYNIIGLYDPSFQTSLGSGLPPGIALNSIHYLLTEYTGLDRVQIAATMFVDKPFEDEQIIFINHFHQILIQSKKLVTSELFTLNDIRKFAIFREQTYCVELGKSEPILEYSTVERLILLYRFSDQADFNLVSTAIDNKYDTYWPHFEIRGNTFFVSSRSDSRKGLALPIREETEKSLSLNTINSLTLSQRHCLIFLVCSVLSRQTCIIQGPTASGKSHLIRLFANLLGRKLITIQLNGDIGISSLTGQFLPKSELLEGDITEIQNILRGLSENEIVSNELAQLIAPESPSTWNPSVLKSVVTLLRRYAARCEDPDKKSQTRSAISVLQSKMSFLHHLQHENDSCPEQSSEMATTGMRTSEINKVAVLVIYFRVFGAAEITALTI
jgi:midasin (ATPase involved in ribosome maturation)